MADDREKTEQPTSRRREEARREGNVATSREVSTFFVVLGGLALLTLFGRMMMMEMSGFMKSSFGAIPATQLTPEQLYVLFRRAAGELLYILLPMLFVPFFGVAAYLLQNGLVLSTKPLAPNLSKLDPLQGAKRLFSLTALAELVKNLVKVSVLTFVVYQAVSSEWERIPSLVDVDTATTLVFMSGVSFTIVLRTLWVLAVIAALDYAYQKWSHERKLRMSKDEVKEEHKETEGDPIVKARIRSIQRSMARRRMMQEVPLADVVVTNPTHLAVALRYDREKAEAPLVVAKGSGLVAERIKEIARSHDVPVVENKPLARALFKAVEIGSEIPFNLYKAVAEVLAYVYRLKNRRIR
ncbi:MAG TPA: flagellar biosynthesis protein FlhB [Deltaproteobacteria bacterium]|nr:flagellar biosynthesis protein FlhB [Deltaproteobacteria bacterium]